MTISEKELNELGFHRINLGSYIKEYGAPGYHCFGTEYTDYPGFFWDIKVRTHPQEPGGTVENFQSKEELYKFMMDHQYYEQKKAIFLSTSPFTNSELCPPIER